MFISKDGYNKFHDLAVNGNLIPLNKDNFIGKYSSLSLVINHRGDQDQGSSIMATFCRKYVQNTHKTTKGELSTYEALSSTFKIGDTVLKADPPISRFPID